MAHQTVKSLPALRQSSRKAAPSALTIDWNDMDMVPTSFQKYLRASDGLMPMWPRRQ